MTNKKELKKVNMIEYEINLEKADKAFKDFKTILAKEIVLANGNIQYDKLEQYISLFNKLKNFTILTSAMKDKKNSINLKDKELDILCKKLSIEDDIIYKTQALLDKMNKFDIHLYIKEIKEKMKKSEL